MYRYKCSKRPAFACMCAELLSHYVFFSIVNEWKLQGMPCFMSTTARKGAHFIQHCIICARVSGVHVACLIKSYQVVCPSFQQFVCFPPSSSGSTGGAALALGRVKGSSWGHTRGEYLGFLGTSVKDFSS